MNYEHEPNDAEGLARHLASLIDACEQYARQQKGDRDRALEYYNGEMRDLVPEEGRSSVVSKDLRGVVKKLMPSIMRTLLSNDKIVEYRPVGPGDEDMAEQASDYINHVVVPEAGVEEAIFDAVADALLIKTGILKWSAYRRAEAKIHSFTGQPSEALAAFAGEPGVEIVSLTSRPETDPALLRLDPAAQRHDFTLRRSIEGTDIRLEAVPRGSFLIHPGSQSIEDSPLVGERQVVSRSELVSRGYDREMVAGLSAVASRADDCDDRIARLGRDWTERVGVTSKAMEEVQIYEVYARLDLDGDGMAELYRLCLAEQGEQGGAQESGSGGALQILELQPADEAPYAKVVAEREAHQFEGHSLAEDLTDIQRIKTALLRQTLDNLYWQNNMQPAVDPSRLTESGLDAVYNPAFGKPITLKTGASVAEAVQWMPVPFVADKSFAMLEYLDGLARERTGVSDQSGGLDPEALRSMTATSAQLISEAGIAQAEMIIRSLARGGIRKALKGLLKLVIAHADRPRTVRLRGRWVQYDPRHWNAGMDCSVNVGLGAGSKERDLSVLQIVLGLQKELLTAIGPDNPFVKPQQLYNVLAKMTEAAGFPSADPYFSRPDDGEIASKLAADQGPSEMEQAIEGQMRLEQVKMQGRAEIEQAQLAADLQLRQVEVQKELQLQRQKAEQAREMAALKNELDLLMHREKLALEREKAGLPPAAFDPPMAAGVFRTGDAPAFQSDDAGAGFRESLAPNGIADDPHSIRGSANRPSEGNRFARAGSAAPVEAAADQGAEFADALLSRLHR